jgi:hypothetical protein
MQITDWIGILFVMPFGVLVIAGLLRILLEHFFG